MQTVVQVICSAGPSLRDAIGGDPKLESFGLQVARQHQPGRSPGWAKLHAVSPEVPGAVNVEWNTSTGTLVCRVVTKGRSRAGPLVGALVNYLLSRYPRRVQTITIVPRR
jgi:hypothetical protein